MHTESAPVAKFTDCHVHLLALPDADNGCYVSQKLLKSPLARNLIRKHGLDLNDPARSNQKYVDDLLGELRGSKLVGKAVLLGMDGTYDEHGRFDRERTDFVISNDYVLQVVKTYPNDSWRASPSIRNGTTQWKSWNAAPRPAPGWSKFCRIRSSSIPPTGATSRSIARWRGSACPSLATWATSSA